MGQQVSTQGTFEERVWPANPGGYGRAARRGGRYQAFIPAPISARSFLLDGEAGASLHAATRALGRLEQSARRVATLGAIAQNLLRSESVASSRIEGVVISQKRLARAAHEDKAKRRGDYRAAAVLGNMEAMKRAIEIGAEGEQFAVADLLDIHRRLLRFTEDRDIAGVIRGRRIGSVAMTTPQLAPSTSHHHPSTSQSFLTIYVASSSRTIFPRSHRRQSRMRSSRQFIHSRMETGVPDAL